MIVAISYTDNYSTNIADCKLSSNRYKSSHLKAVVINCQSLKSKKATFGCFVDAHKPDIIFGTESWLSPSISSSKIFPHGYNIYRQDRPDGYGGVFLAIHSKLISRKILFTIRCKAVASLITLDNSQSLIVCSVYRPPYNDVSYLQQLCSDLYRGFDQ